MALKFYPEISKSWKTSDNTTYAFAHVSAASGKPTFLLLHGFPSTSFDWRLQIPGLVATGYGVLAPDLLGYGDSDKPSDTESYSFKRMADHMSELLKAEEVNDVIGVGHDWGSGLLSRLAQYHRECFKGFIFMAVGYIEPGVKYDLDVFNDMTEQILGYSTFGYWELFNKEAAGELLTKNDAAATSLFSPKGYETWKTDLGPRMRAEEWIKRNETTAPPDWMTVQDFDTHVEVMSKGGYTGPLNWYKAAIRGVDNRYDESLPKPLYRVEDKPLLYVGGKRDYITTVEMNIDRTSKWVNSPGIEIWECGHWIQLEEPEKTLSLFKAFAKQLG